jgi:hypothetical protein
MDILGTLHTLPLIESVFLDCTVHTWVRSKIHPAACSGVGYTPGRLLSLTRARPCLRQLILNVVERLVVALVANETLRATEAGLLWLTRQNVRTHFSRCRNRSFAHCALRTIFKIIDLVS